MVRVNNSDFLKQFGDVLEGNSGKSSIYLTQKRLSPALDLDQDEGNGIKDLSSNVIPHDDKYSTNSTEYPILIRIATNDKSKKLKISTVVETAQLEQFWVNYAQVIKSGFIGLKKKDKKKSKKSKVSK